MGAGGLVLGVRGCVSVLRDAASAVPDDAMRGEYVVESHELWTHGDHYEPWDLYVGSTVRVTAATFEGLGANARYEMLGDGRMQVGGDLWKAGWKPDGRLVIAWTGERFVLRRR